jgi:hypothetical protein
VTIIILFYFFGGVLMVRVGDTILINNKIKAIVTALLRIEKEGRWVIGFEQPDGTTSFIIEGNEKFSIVD